MYVMIYNQNKHSIFWSWHPENTVLAKHRLLIGSHLKSSSHVHKQKGCSVEARCTPSKHFIGWATKDRLTNIELVETKPLYSDATHTQKWNYLPIMINLINYVKSKNLFSY